MHKALYFLAFSFDSHTTGAATLYTSAPIAHNSRICAIFICSMPFPGQACISILLLYSTPEEPAAPGHLLVPDTWQSVCSSSALPTVVALYIFRMSVFDRSFRLSV